VCLQVLQVLQVLTADPANEVWIISGRSQQELGGWFESLVRHTRGHTGCFFGEGEGWGARGQEDMHVAGTVGCVGSRGGGGSVVWFELKE